jgi:hypothetical protein
MQQNHHCLLSFHGHMWTIYRVRKMQIHCERRVTSSLVVTQVIDISGVDFESYAEACLAWDYRMAQEEEKL